MTPSIQELMATLWEAAEKATKGRWRSPWLPGSKQRCAGVEVAGDHYIVLHVDKDNGYHPDTVERWKLDCLHIAAASPENILRLRDYIHDLSTRCDPAGELAERRLLEEAVKAQDLLIEELKGLLKEYRDALETASDSFEPYQGHFVDEVMELKLRIKADALLLEEVKLKDRQATR